MTSKTRRYSREKLRCKILEVTLSQPDALKTVRVFLNWKEKMMLTMGRTVLSKVNSRKSTINASPEGVISEVSSTCTRVCGWSE